MTSEQHLPLAGKVALITGSSQGIGLATAQRLARNGADIVINYRDVSQEEDVARLFAETNQSLGAITILVNNAGTTRDKLILQMTLADFEHVIDNNLRSAFLCTRAALRGMMKARWGRIVNISSVAGLLGSAGQANYGASKAAIIALTL
ncbi:MAG: SDR family NAD(P)-dependent oxidoreductase, partial [Chloroflexi bacterium]